MYKYGKGSECNNAARLMKKLLPKYHAYRQKEIEFTGEKPKRLLQNARKREIIDSMLKRAKELENDPFIKIMKWILKNKFLFMVIFVSIFLIISSMFFISIMTQLEMSNIKIQEILKEGQNILEL